MAVTETVDSDLGQPTYSAVTTQFDSHHLSVG
jgi:hypothetical protein